MLVFRVEHGIYRSGPYITEKMKTEGCRMVAAFLQARHDNSIHHPNPCCPNMLEDGLCGCDGKLCLADFPIDNEYGLKYTDCHCAFCSLQQLCSWFSEYERVVMQAGGYVVSVFDSETVIHGHSHHQIFFRKIKGQKRLNTLDIVTFNKAN